MLSELRVPEGAGWGAGPEGGSQQAAEGGERVLDGELAQREEANKQLKEVRGRFPLLLASLISPLSPPSGLSGPLSASNHCHDLPLTLFGASASHDRSRSA